MVLFLVLILLAFPQDISKMLLTGRIISFWMHWGILYFCPSEGPQSTEREFPLILFDLGIGCVCPGVLGI